jgi:uncharacterized LabA/DUF88 family protein
VTTTDRLRIAVFIDFDNIEIGVKNTLGAAFDAGLVLEALKERGEVVSKMAYSDWQRAAGGYSRMLSQHAIRMVQRNLTPGGDKNGADINLALDALEMAFTHPHINAFVVVAGDSDFISLVEKLKQYDKKVFVVGGRQFTSGILQRNCHEFIAYENLLGSVGSGAGAAPRRGFGRDGRGDRPTDRASIEQAIPLVTRGLKVLSERELTPQLGLLKTTLLQLDSTFSERSFGAGSFRDFVQKLEKLGIVRLTQTKGGWLVGSADSAGSGGDAAPGGEEDAAPHTVGEDAGSMAQEPAPAQSHGSRPPVAAVTGTPAEGVAELRAILGAVQIRRWPLYLRNVKQLIRQVNPAFDERAYGFGNLVDLLRAAHRDGVVRVERDRQGVTRVFQGSVAPLRTAPVPAPAVEGEAARADDITVEETPPLPVFVEEPVPDVAAEADGEAPGDNIGNVEQIVAPELAPKSRRRRSSSGGGPSRAPRGRGRRPRK